MKNEKMLAKLLTLLFVVSLTFNLFAQEKTKNEEAIIIKTKLKKDGKAMTWDIKKDNDFIWVVNGDSFEWDTTFTVEGNEDFDMNIFLKKRFPEMDSMKSKKIITRIEGTNRYLKVVGGAYNNKLLQLTNDIIIDKDAVSLTLNIEEMDSLLSNHKILKNCVVIGDLSSKLKVLHKNLDGLKYEILTSIDEDDDEHIVRLELLKDVGENMKNFEIIMHDGDKSKLKNVYELHTSEFRYGLAIDDELKQEDFDFLKKSGIKMGKEKLDLSTIFFYYNEDEFVNLKFKLKTEGKTTIKIINEVGKEVFVDKVDYFPGTYDKQTELIMENKGTYYVSIEQNGKTNAFKVKLD